MLSAAHAFLSGLCDALRIDCCITFFVSPIIRRRTLQCLTLNGFIFLGSIFFLDGILNPLLGSLLSAPAETQSAMLKDVSGMMEFVLTWTFRFLWVYPMYCISFILSAVWYQDIADHTYVLHRGAKRLGPITVQRIWKAVAEEIDRMFLVTYFLLQITLSSFVPFVGAACATVQMAWLYSLYSFEYKWTLDEWSLDSKLAFCEFNWGYMAGFGLPAALITLAFPKFVSLGIFALIFPIFIMMATVASPTDNSADYGTTRRCPPSRLPIFKVAKWVNAKVLRYICRSRLTKPPSAAPPAPVSQ